ncbi:MAG: hypothetical protein M1820_008891 [Bogoriella megaspora]|nr:MAG: hypothetical protein M1820_008891 [Bogoriella megaspora]
MKSHGDNSRRNLERHGIIYDDAYTCDHDAQESSDDRNAGLPNNVKALRDTLLSFPPIIPLSKKKLFVDELKHHDGKQDDNGCFQPPTTAYFDRDLRRSTKLTKDVGKEIKDCEKSAKSARESAKRAEDGWTSVWRKNVFGDFEQLETLRTEIEEGNFAWTEFKRWQTPKLNIQRRKSPQPDLTYGFPIISHSDCLPAGFAEDDYVQSFSLDVLRRLRSNEVFTAPASGLRRLNKNGSTAKIEIHDKLCFPWAIVEFKDDQASPAEIKECYCQAANGSAAALSLRERLFHQAQSQVPKTVPPVIAFTCIGPRIKLWLTYRSEEHGRKITKMSCIWSTSIELTWGVWAVRHIVQTMHIWASRCLRPKLAAAVSQICENLDNNVPLPLTSRTSHDSTLPLTPPATPESSRRRSRSTPMRESLSRNGEVSATCRVRSQSADSKVEDDGSSGKEADDGSEEERNDGRYSEELDGKLELPAAIPFVDQVLSRDDDGEFIDFNMSEDEDDEDENIADTEGDERSEIENGLQYTEEELEERRRLAPYLLSGPQFAKLDILKSWFESLSSARQVKAIMKLVDTSQGGLAVSGHPGPKRKRLSYLVTNLNNALRKDGYKARPLTSQRLRCKSWKRRVQRGFKLLETEDRLVCLRDCMLLRNEGSGIASVHEVLEEFLKIISGEERAEMEAQAFKLLNQRDQNSDLLH